ncbi:UNVERIFIED_CONTAM: hypothetical protein PYX00_006236 [Menopon gallinae]|uniref:Cation/H+ exchanger transmembrane domain-containing protein n=1 Tax=Menopon gallinae TaxID=328185 RepID=A0AAW2HW71_9NEOP
MSTEHGHEETSAHSDSVSIPEYSKHRPAVISDGRLSPHHHFQRKTSVTSDHSDGPVRRKSILHNASYDNHIGHHLNHGYHPTEEDKQWNGDIHHDKFHRSVSRSNSFYSDKGRQASEDEDSLVNSWWYLFCMKCRQKESKSSWEPPHWQKVCPYPFCPSYRQFARLVALILVGLLLWGVVYCIIGPTAAPGGQLFGLAVLCICANFGGWFATMLTLPALSGMLLVGVLFQNLGLIHIDEDYKELCSIVRKIALVIILIRAGLDLDPKAMKRLYFTLIKMGLVPWIVECGVMAVMAHYLLDFPWMWGFLLGSVVAAVSPAVVVPCLIRLRSKGYGIAKGIPTLIIAVSGIDDAASVAVFGIIHSVMFSNESLVYNILLGPLSVIVGIGFGVIWGTMAQFIPEKDDPFVIPLRILLLFGGGLISVFGSEEIGFGGAGPLGCVTLAFVSFLFWGKQGWDVEDNPAATAFEIFWMIFEPILFGITGTEVKIDEMEPTLVGIGVACLLTGIILRIIATVLLGYGTKLNTKEKVFAALSWMAKATVQAALAPVVLDSLRSSKSENEKHLEYAERILLICVLSIILTAPLGAIIISLSGPKLLTKTSSAPSTTEWRRRSHRPSIRDMSIIDEEEEVENRSQEDNKSRKFLGPPEEFEIHEVKKDSASSHVSKKEGETADGTDSKS